MWSSKPRDAFYCSSIHSQEVHGNWIVIGRVSNIELPTQNEDLISRKKASCSNDELTIFDGAIHVMFLIMPWIFHFVFSRKYFVNILPGGKEVDRYRGGGITHGHYGCKNGHVTWMKANFFTRHSHGNTELCIRETKLKISLDFPWPTLTLFKLTYAGL